MAATNSNMVASAGPKYCSQCGGNLAPGVKFCAQCGAPLSASSGAPPPSAASAPPPPPPPPGPDPSAAPPGPAAPAGPASNPAYGAPPVAPSAPPGNDIRSRVDQDRGVLKKLQLMVPGYRGYRQGEDIRAADSLLRLQIADRLVTAMGQLDTIRNQMARDGVMAGIVALGGLRSEMQRLEGQIRHAEGGYSGLSSTIKVTPQTLDNLYQRDWTFVASADQVLQSVGSIGQAVQTKDAPTINTSCDALRDNLKGLQTAFEQRLESVEGILQ